MTAAKWSTACPDWERRIVAGESMIALPPLFPAEAASALDVFSALKVVDAPGMPTMGESCRPWMIEFVSAIFGAYDPESGRRAITEFLLLISKKNTKSTSAAGIMMTALIRNWRKSAEFLILAPTIEIANNSFYPARDMIKEDDELRDLMQLQEHTRTITNRKTGAQLKVVAADSETVGGKKATGVVVDELWLFGKRANAENMLREACGGMASRPEGFTIYLSTQSDEPPAGVFRQKLQYARAVRDGRVKDPRFLPVLYEFPKAMIEAEAYRDAANLHITNPNLGTSVDEEFLRHELKKAVEAGAESECGFFAKHANVEIGLKLMSDRWAGADYWEKCGDPKITLDYLIERAEVVTVGIDGGGLDDLLGFSAIGRDFETGAWLTWTHAWAHPIVLERRKSEASKFMEFVKDGDLTLVDALGKDTDDVAAIVERLEHAGKLDKIGVDPAGIGGIVDAIMAKGIEAERIVAISQGWRMMGAIKTTERKLAGGQMVHGAQRLMNYCVGNAKVEQRGNAILITKQAAGSAKIDPLAATFNAAELMGLNPAPKAPQLMIW